MSNLAVSTVAQGLLWAVMALGVYVTFRVLDLADLTCEGSFPLGAATAATLMASGHSVSTAILAAAVAGMLAGAVTGFLTTKMKIPALLAGILTMIALYSVNLRIMGKAKPQDMAIRSQKEFKAVVNQKKADQLGIKIPAELLKGAEVIK